MKNVFRISRRLEPGQYCLADIFGDIRTSRIFTTIFADGAEIDQVMERTKVHGVDRPDEMFQEARRIGLSDDAISHYLRVSLITPEEHERLTRRLAVAEDIQERMSDS